MAGNYANLHAHLLEPQAHGVITPAGEWTHVCGPDDAAGLELPSQIRDDPLRPPMEHDEPAGASAQRLVEIGQALEQELRPRPGGVAAAEQLRVETEDGHDRPAFVLGRLKGWMVVEAEIAPEPEERCHLGAAMLAAASTGSSSSHRAPTASARPASVPAPASARGATQASSLRPPRAL